MTPLKQRGKIRRKNIYTIRLNSITPLKQWGKIGRSNIYIKGGDQTDKYIYSKIEKDDSTKTKTENQSDTYIY
jgi:hypothetical protein